jgi:hypothetical protein
MLLDEVRIFGEAAGVEIQRDLVARGYFAHGAQVGDRNRLASARIIRDGDHHQRDFFGAVFGDETLECGHVHVAFERNARLRVGGFGQGEIDGFGAREFDVGARRVEVRVVGNDVSGLQIKVKRMRSAARPW